MKKSKLGPEPLILPMPALVVGANINGKPNFMIASWCGIAAYKPPAITIAMNKARYTLKGIRENGTFSVNVPSCEMIKKTDYCGIYSGRKKDKSQIFRTFYGELKTAPLIEECPINLKCKSLHHLDMRTHILIVGEIIETYITSECLKDGKVDPEKIDPPVYIRPTMKYHRLGEVLTSAFNVGREDGDARNPETILSNNMAGYSIWKVLEIGDIGWFETWAYSLIKVTTLIGGAIGGGLLITGRFCRS